MTADETRSFVSYCPETGIFRWLPRVNPSPESWNSTWAGKIAGTTNDRGYRTICINQIDYFAHRLAWVIMTNKWPTADIDHINMIKADNRWENLREATRTENFYNRHVRRDCVSGLKGAHKYKGRKLWGSAILIGGKKVSLGNFSCPAAAHFAYAIAASEAYGKFARPQ
jgi:hypothetical protein